jgi:hypothetical protein
LVATVVSPRWWCLCYYSIYVIVVAINLTVVEVLLGVNLNSTLPVPVHTTLFNNFDGLWLVVVVASYLPELISVNELANVAV